MKCSASQSRRAEVGTPSWMLWPRVVRSPKSRSVSSRRDRSSLRTTISWRPVARSRPRSAFVADFVGAANRLPARVTQVDSDGRYRVATDGIGVPTVAGPETLVTGAEVIVVIRPEELRLDGTAPAGSPALTATVADVAFLGAHRSVRLDSPTLVRLVATTSGGRLHRRGDEITVGWADDDAWAVPVGGPSPSPAE
jgi:ABC-type Fe3+/spermidine/putrescine transport system ATPase subunit